MTPDYLTLCRVAAERHDLHRDHASSRPLSDGYELVGLVGEAEFSRLFNVPMNLERMAGGDNGVDFVINGRTIDIKTARKAFNLIVEQGHVCCDVYVLANPNRGVTGAELLGWAGRKDIEKAPVRDFGHGIDNHYIPADKLRTIYSLVAALT